jgi:pimeloyl-ACP methyl ester carboxylesterase
VAFRDAGAVRRRFIGHGHGRVERDRIRVQFIHGLESSPQGRKAQLFERYFEACTKAMNTGDFWGCVEVQAKAIDEFHPDVLVGSSFGGAVAVALLRRNQWRGPTVLLAQAALRYDPDARLPNGIPVILVHGLKDDVIDIEDSRKLARTGSPQLVRLIEVDDGHELKALVDSGRLVEIIRQAATLNRNR